MCLWFNDETCTKIFFMAQYLDRCNDTKSDMLLDPTCLKIMSTIIQCYCVIGGWKLTFWIMFLWFYCRAIFCKIFLCYLHKNPRKQRRMFSWRVCGWIFYLICPSLPMDRIWFTRLKVNCDLVLTNCWCVETV